MSKNLEIHQKIVWLGLKDWNKETLSQYSTGTPVCSPCFKVSIGGNLTEWFFKLYPNGKHSSCSSYVSLFLFRKDTGNYQYEVDVDICIGSKENPIAATSFNRPIDDFKMGFGCRKLIEPDKYVELADELIINGRLKISLEMTIKQKKSPGSNTQALSHDFRKMFEESLFADFKLICGDKQSLECHKSIITARSPVFFAMISNDMTEARQGFAMIPDFDSGIMRQVLRFMYCGEVEDLDNIAKELIFAAEKYQLDGLKEMCIESIAKNLATNNAVEVMTIGDSINECGMLFEKAVNVIEKDYFNIIMTEEWKSLPKSLLQKFVNRVMTCNSETIVIE